MLNSLFRRCAAIVFVLILTSSAAAQSSGTISGRVTDAVSGAPLIGADVALDGTAFIVASDRTGTFLITGVPPGDYNLLVLYLGHTEERASVTVTPGTTVTVEVSLRPASFTEVVRVTAAPIAEGQARALNQQRTALNITNVVSADQIGSFPDPNAAEAAQRIPGVSITRDQGEGRYVLVRGTEARLNSMMIDGERIPAPEGDLRQVALDAVPADQLQSIEVSKAVTPDMDADSIGGAVNLVTKQAVGRPTMLFSAAAGYNALQEDAGQSRFSGTAGRRVDGGRIGLLLGGSASSLNRGSENFEATYDEGELADFQNRDYIINRERYGLNGTADVQLRPGSSLVFRGIFNEFRDYEINNRIRYRPSNSRIEHVLKNRNQNQHIRSLAGNGQHVVRGDITLDYRLHWAQSQEEQPDRLDTIFRQSRIAFSPNVTATSIDPENIQPNPSQNIAANATLNAWETEIFTTTDRDVTGAFNLRMPIRTSGDAVSFLKAGAKFKDKRKVRDFEATEASPEATVPFGQLQDTGFDNDAFMSYFPATPGYGRFPGINPDASRALYNSVGRPNGEVNREGDSENYEATERVGAAYVMAELFLGPKLTLLPGLRYESTTVDYLGYEVTFDEDGDYASTQSVTGGDTYGFLLPGVHLRYAVDENTNVRAAFTRTLARPNYFDLVPYQIVIQEDAEIQRGNSSLEPTTSSNIDLLVERYFSTVGVVSGGLFYKRLSNYIYPFTFVENTFGDVFEVTQPQNGDSASLWGLEFALQNRLTFLPGPLDGIGVYANYTWTDSSAQFPGRTTDSTLPGQSSNLGNVALWYEKYGFSARASWNFHGKYIDAVGPDASQDVYYDNRVQVDLNLSQRLTRRFTAFADFLNLTNAPLRYYIGSTNRPIQEEYYRWWAMFGVKANF